MTHLVTVGFQCVNFVLLLFLLERYLWKPVRATIERRRKDTDDAEAAMKARAKATDDLRATCEATARDAEAERARMNAGNAAALATERDRMLAETRAVTDAERRAGRAELEHERITAVAELTDATLEVTLALAQKLVGDVHGSAVTSAFLDRICESLDHLPPAELASLREEVEASPTIHVATAQGLDEPARAGLRAHLAPHFGPTMQLEFVIDGALIAGAELRFPHVKIGYSFQQSLAAARRSLAPVAEPGAAAK